MGGSTTSLEEGLGRRVSFLAESELGLELNKDPKILETVRRLETVCCRPVPDADTERWEWGTVDSSSEDVTARGPSIGGEGAFALKV